MNVRLHPAAMGSQHNCATKRFTAGKQRILRTSHGRTYVPGLQPAFTTFRCTHALTSTTILPLTCLPRGTLRQDTLTVVLRDVLMGLVPLYIAGAKADLTYFYSVRISTRTLFPISCPAPLAVATFE